MNALRSTMLGMLILGLAAFGTGCPDHPHDHDNGDHSHAEGEHHDDHHHDDGEGHDDHEGHDHHEHGEMTEALSTYLAVQQLLFEQKPAEAIEAAGPLVDAGNEAIGGAAKALQSAEGNEAIDAAFGKLSEAVIAAHPRLPEDVYKAYCPMVKKQWLQTGDEVNNPYAPDTMPHCGSIQE